MFKKICQNIFDKIRGFFLIIKKDKLLVAVLLLAAVLRLLGVGYGLPLQLNIDEPALISTTSNLNDNLNPGRFDWPHLYFYIVAFFFGVLGVARAVISKFADVPFLYTPAALFVTGRLVTIMFGTLTIIPIYLITKTLFKSREAAILAALIAAVLPVHVEESHLAKLDVAQAFFVALSLYYIVRIYETGQRKFYVWAGIFIGLATSIKYNGFLMFLPLVLAFLLRFEKSDWLNFKVWKNVIINSFVSGVISIIFFYLGTPFALIDYKKFWSHERGIGALWQFENVGHISSWEYPFKIFNTFANMYRDNMGLGIWAVFILLSILFLFFNKREKSYTLLLLPVLIFTFYIGRFERSPAHYYIFLIPMYVPAIASFIMELKSKIPNKYAGLVLMALIIIPSLYKSSQNSVLYLGKDTRTLAYEWVRDHVNEQQDYLYVYGDDLESVPFQEKNSTRVKRLEVDHLNVKQPPYYVVIGVRNLNRAAIVYDDRDPEELPGNSRPILKDADLVYEISNEGRMGPPIYIFYVKALGH